ncbi:MAG: hypothetical protein OEZ59_11245, partial [Deltaproteobacteria bacterium]|nr:hypothetical protein [Deltaproteobacteria bacterium]
REIKLSTREQIITCHGLPPRLVGIILDAKAGAMGGKELKDEMDLFNLSFVEPEQQDLENFLNPHLPHEIKFKPFLLSRTEKDGGKGTSGDGNQAEDADTNG